MTDRSTGTESLAETGDEADYDEFHDEAEFGDQARDLAAREIVPGVLGEAIIRNVEQVSDTWHFTLEMPGGTERLLRLDANPPTRTHRLFAFLNAVGVDPNYIMDAERETAPVVLIGDAWAPVFPAENTRTSRVAFRNILWATKKGLATTRERDGTIHLSLQDWPRHAYSGGLTALLALVVLVSGFTLLRFAPYLLVFIVLGGLYIIRKGLAYSYTLFDTPVWPLPEA